MNPEKNRQGGGGIKLKIFYVYLWTYYKFRHNINNHMMTIKTSFRELNWVQIIILDFFFVIDFYKLHLNKGKDIAKNLSIKKNNNSK